MKWLICRTNYSGEYSDWCLFALIHVDASLLDRIEKAREAVKEAKAGYITMAHATFYDYTIVYLDSYDGFASEEASDEEHDEVESFFDDLEHEWVECPFPVDLAAQDVGKTATCCMIVEARGAVYWTTYPKHTSIRVETPYLPDPTDLEKLAMAGEGK